MKRGDEGKQRKGRKRAMTKERGGVSGGWKGRWVGYGQDWGGGRR